jgi:hypothetical protein
MGHRKSFLRENSDREYWVWSVSNIQYLLIAICNSFFVSCTFCVLYILPSFYANYKKRHSILIEQPTYRTSWPKASYDGLIFYMDTKAKFRHLKKLNCKGTLWQVFICLRLSPLRGFILGWSSNFVGSESGRYRVQNMVSNREKVRCSTGHKVGRKYQYEWLYL